VDETFGIKRRLLLCKFRPPRFNESSVRVLQVWVPLQNTRFMLLSTNRGDRKRGTGKPGARTIKNAGLENAGMESARPVARPRRRRISSTYRVEFPWRRSRRLTSHAAVGFFSAPPPSYLMSSFSTQSLNLYCNVHFVSSWHSCTLQNANALKKIKTRP